jgi:hypothetical protein
MMQLTFARVGVVAGLLLTSVTRAATLSFVSPAPEAQFNAGTCIPLQATADPATASIRYYDGAALIGEAPAPSYRWMWTTASRGAHTIRAVADAAGGGASGSVSITVNDPTPPVDLAGDVDAYNVTFTNLGVNARDSMPLGNGDVTLNAWTYPNGDVGLLIGKMDAFSRTTDENLGWFALRKIGRVRIVLDPPLFKQAADAQRFRQTLVMSDATIRFTGTGGSLKVWVDKNRPVIHAEYAGTTAVVMSVRNDPWRTAKVALTHYADIVLPGLTNQVAWCYHDPRTSVAYRTVHEGTLVESGLAGADLMPKYTTVAFGALIEGGGFSRVDDKTLRSSRATSCRADINILRDSKQGDATPAKWLSLIRTQTEENRGVNPAEAWSEHRRWWRDYWDRGSLRITSGTNHFDVTSQYLQQRFVNACQAGAVKELWRIPFNGGLFSVDFLDVDMGKGLGVNIQNTNTMMTADYRLWGAVDRSQNTRHVYGPMLMSGDYDLARAWYRWPAVMAKSWQKTVLDSSGRRDCFTSAGVAFWESLRPRQLVDRRSLAAGRIIPETVGLASGAFNWCVDTTDEYLPYMLDYYELTQDEDFLRNDLLPYAAGLFKFFDEFFPRDSQGKLLLWPCQQSEVYVRYPTTGFVPANPVSGVALLHTQLPRLLALANKAGADTNTVALW